MLDDNDFTIASADDTSVVVLEDLSLHPQLSLLNKFADWRNFSMHEAIARNPQAPSAILEKLAGENEKEIRDLVKNHPNV
ncbi:MAG: hypothetical protein ACYT04_84505, partial [Nostoc sp.]